MAATAAAALARRGRDDDRPLAPTSFAPVASPPPSFAPSSSSSTIALPRFLRRAVPGDSFSSSANRTDRGRPRARGIPLGDAPLASVLPRPALRRDARRCPTRPSATPGPGLVVVRVVGNPHHPFLPPGRHRGWGGALPPPMSLRLQREILCTARALTCPCRFTAKRQTQQQPRATVGCPNRPRRRIESVVGLFTQGQLPIGN